jgi:Zn-dependent alcohol dehydrogenase
MSQQMRAAVLRECPGELVSARIGLDEINDGYRSLVKGAVARSVVVFPDVT